MQWSEDPALESEMLAGPHSVLELDHSCNGTMK